MRNFIIVFDSSGCCVERASQNTKKAILDAWAQHTGPGWQGGAGVIRRRPLVYHIGSITSGGMNQRIYLIRAQSRRAALQYLETIIKTNKEEEQ